MLSGTLANAGQANGTFLKSGGAPEPTAAPQVVRSGQWDGQAWQLIAYPNGAHAIAPPSPLLPRWGGKGPLGDVPCFVVTRNPPATSATVFSFVTEGIESALAKAQAAAGEKRIGLMGANIDQQFLAAGLVDEIRIHVVNVLLGGGRRLFDQLPQRIELEQTGLSETDGATHLEYRVVQ